jgi:hypothetical protein
MHILIEDKINDAKESSHEELECVIFSLSTTCKFVGEFQCSGKKGKGKSVPVTCREGS